MPEFTFSETHRISEGNVIVVYGNYINSDGSEGGTITVRDLHYIIGVTLQPTGATVKNDISVLNEFFSGQPPKINSNSFTIVTTPNELGLWKAIGV